uniref:Uncharacterized protein n=1 Tax=uncultured prokaryote TaxID=198431 RepID=A0A0H5Q1S8_9ZZZZ|nr:hypothetical protein [uncultured prokaryote]
MIKYKRSPRLIKRVPTEAISIKNPPEKKEISKTSLAQIIITPLIMLSITVAVSIMMKRGIYVLMSIVSTVVSVIGSVSKFIHDKKETREQNREREELYDQYLLDMRKRISAAKSTEEEAYDYNYPTVEKIESMIKNRSSRIYERSAGDDDFLTFSVGYRREPVRITIA